VGLRADAIVSSMMGWGQGDKVRSARPGRDAWLSDAELSDLVVGDGLAHRLTYGLARDAVSPGWTTAAGDDEDVTTEIDTDLALRSTMAYALGVARHTGGAHLLPVMRGAGADLATPLSEGEHEIVAVHVLGAMDARPLRWDLDPESPAWGAPLTWMVQPIRQGVSLPAVEVHRSRMVYIPGAPTAPHQHCPRLGYDLPWLDIYWPRLRHLGMALEAATLGAVELSTPWLRLKTSAAAVSGDKAATVADRLSLWSQKRSMMGTSVLIGEDEAGRDNVSLTGLRTESVLAAYEGVSAIEGLPLVRIFGMSPAGMTSDDQSARRSWGEWVRTQTEDVVAPALLELYAMAFGRADREIRWMPPGEVPTAREEADTEAVRAQTASAMIASGVWTPDEVRARYEGYRPSPYVRVSAPEPVDIEPTAEEIDAAEAP